MIEVFHQAVDAIPYALWIANNPNGFVLDQHSEGNNHWGGCFHKARCKHIVNYLTDDKNALSASAFSDGRYKACSNDKDGLRDWGRYVRNGKGDNQNSEPSPCKHCNPFS